MAIPLEQFKLTPEEQQQKLRQVPLEQFTAEPELEPKPEKKNIPIFQSMVQGMAQPFGKLAASAASAGKGIYGLGKAGIQYAMGDKEKALQSVVGAGKPVELDLGYAGQYKPMESAKEAMGVGAEIGLTALPFTKAGTTFLRASGKFLPQVARFSEWGALLGASQAIEEGKDIKGVIKQGAISGVGAGLTFGAFKGAEKLATKAIKGLPSVFSVTTTGQKKAFEFQLKNPKLSATAVKLGKSPDDIAQGMTKAIKKYQVDMLDEYAKGITELAKKYPKKTFGAERYWFPKEQIDSIFNKVGGKFDIQVTKQGLQFAKGGRISSIAKGAEQTRIKEIYSALKNWKDFSAEGSSKLLNYLNKLRKFETTVGTRESKFVGGIIEEIRTPIFNRWQGMEGIFNNYSTKIKFANEVSRFLKATKQADAVAQTGATQNIMKIFNVDKEPLFRMAERFEKETGLSILAELSAAELSSGFPPLIRSVLGVGGAVAALIRPEILLALPLFIQRSASAAARMAGRALPFLPKLTETASKIGAIGISKILSKIQK